ncbi:hypothetical protein ACFO3O_06740 [Dokdonia ponticola]|uniref:T9SS type A sorting domain-containing protein n=1 Tax=Dokdonia ponticola TaxID=2041041 RepID=A0ABV9HUP4_9FLAO
MKHRKNIPLIFCLFMSLFAMGQNNNQDHTIQLLTNQTDFEVGSAVALQFSSSQETQSFMYCSNSYGTILISPTIENKILSYTIPDFITNKSGVINWKLVDDSSVSGSLMMYSKKEVTSMETYIGPPTIEAGGTDYTMLVVIPTDSLDNPLPENTIVTSSYQFLATQKEEDIVTNNIIAYQNIYSQKKSGRLFISSECLETHSKEYTIDVLPAIPTNFTISATRSHNYADGNQITSFHTSILKDAHGNTVSDGTFVTFFIRNKKGNILKTSGTTVQGIATSKMIHPDHEDQWSIKAYVQGMAESNTITVAYQQVVKEVETAFAKANREINVGPLQSFMGQMIPDGFQVSLEVYKNERLLTTYTETSKNGHVSFELMSAIFENGIYTLKVKTAGLEKNYPNMKLW